MVSEHPILSIKKYTLSIDEYCKEIEKNTSKDIINDLNNVYKEYKLTTDKLNSLIFTHISNYECIIEDKDVIYLQGVILGIIISYKYTCFNEYQNYKQGENKND